MMLHLKEPTPNRWLTQVDTDLEEILVDHAHCEHKAAATALSLLGAYIDCRPLTEAMTEIVAEELEHFHMVRDLLERRGIPFRRLRPGNYAQQLRQLIRSTEPERGVDRLLVAGLIEARSCERFKLLKSHVQDPELAQFYGSLFESEARHHTTYIRLAKLLADPEAVERRLAELSAAESAIIEAGHPLPRMHS
jgi:tRNA-(ms[2]io[6]A)-hydroxylase